jgi:hypothetical protein
MACRAVDASHFSSPPLPPPPARLTRGRPYFPALSPSQTASRSIFAGQEAAPTDAEEELVGDLGSARPFGELELVGDLGSARLFGGLQRTDSSVALSPGVSPHKAAA